jgi:soluble epoxide hydrolase/lipid-phosphate phosphatase
MTIQPIDPTGDSRITHKTAVLNGYTYHYLYAEPKSGQYSQTMFLVWVPISLIS